jgi:hypothetical protein
MTVGLLFGAFWYGLGVLTWWWPAAIFVAFSNDDVTPGARAFAVGFVFIGAFFLTTAVPELGGKFTLPGTVLTVGVLVLLHPIQIPGTDRDGPITPLVGGVGLIVASVVLAVLAVV